MKNRMVRYFITALLILQLVSCSDKLNEEVYSQLFPDNYLNTEAGLNDVLISAYNGTDGVNFAGQRMVRRMFMSIFPSGYGWGQGGTIEAQIAVPFKNFTWDSNNVNFSMVWNKAFITIRNTNIILDNIDRGNFSDTFKKNIVAEAKAIRGFHYALLYNLFGTTPIFTTTNTTELKRARASTEEMLLRIETDLSEAAQDLPVVQTQYGRVTKGAALSALCKHYLNTRQWEKCATTSKQIIDLNVYKLQANYKSIFSITNEGNSELIWVHPADVANVPENVLALVLPTDYPLLPNQSTSAAKLYTYDWVLDSYEANDVRKQIFIKSYVTSKGVTVKGYGLNKSVCLKYEPDPNAAGVMMGNDVPELRYADILLARSEALNELSGPTQESITLINQVRARAGASPLALGGLTKENLRDQILKERFLEFYFEAKEREDLIRQGKFISNAVKNGVVNAKDTHTLFPIPQTEIDANPNIIQNPGY